MSISFQNLKNEIKALRKELNVKINLRQSRPVLEKELKNLRFQQEVTQLPGVSINDPIKTNLLKFYRGSFKQKKKKLEKDLKKYNEQGLFLLYNKKSKESKRFLNDLEKTIGLRKQKRKFIKPYTITHKVFKGQVLNESTFYDKQGITLNEKSVLWDLYQSYNNRKYDNVNIVFHLVLVGEVEGYRNVHLKKDFTQQAFNIKHQRINKK